jgi:hypothetical protein
LSSRSKQSIDVEHRVRNEHEITIVGLNGGFSEMAMYVLVEHGDQWWLAAGQNTPAVGSATPVSPS